MSATHKAAAMDRVKTPNRFRFRIPLGDHGDVYDRYMIRLLEMRESINIHDSFCVF